jgi:hypothetical protein
MTVAPTAILAVAATGMFVAVIWLILGMARHRDRPAPGHRLRPDRRHNRPAPWPPEHASRDRAARAASFGVNEEWYEGARAYGHPRIYGPVQLWGDVPDDPPDWR